jgi:hypothetical protein
MTHRLSKKKFTSETAAMEWQLQFFQFLSFWCGAKENEDWDSERLPAAQINHLP